MNLQYAKPAQQIVAAIAALDLEPIKFKLMDAEEGHGWSHEKVERLELDYKRFLTLLAKYPDMQIAPSKDIDRFWHAHILDTMKYAEDCQSTFGTFLHHFPYFGMRGADDAAALARAADAMNSIYQREFGEAMPGREGSFCCAETRADAAFCCATAEKRDAAFCCAAVETKAAAFCCASASSNEAAFCCAAAGRTDAAFCCASTKADVHTRPALAIAA